MKLSWRHQFHKLACGWAECHGSRMDDEQIRSFNIIRGPDHSVAYRIEIFMTANQVTSRIQTRYYTMFQLKMQVFFLTEPAPRMAHEMLK